MSVRRAGAAISLVAFTLVGLASFLVGITLDGWNPPEVQCATAGEWPSTGGPFLESTEIEAQRTYVPLGMTCSYDAPDDLVGPQTISHPNWPATILVIASVAVVAFSGARMVKPDVR